VESYSEFKVFCATCGNQLRQHNSATPHYERSSGQLQYIDYKLVCPMRYQAPLYKLMLDTVIHHEAQDVRVDIDGNVMAYKLSDEPW
jgi:hypothetical protein